MSWVTKPPLHIRGDNFRWSLVSTYSLAVSNTVICLPFRPGLYKYHVAGHHGDGILYCDNNTLGSSVRNLPHVKIGRLEFWDGSLILGKFVHLCYRPIQSCMEWAWAKYFSSHLWILQSIVIFSSLKNYRHLCLIPLKIILIFITFDRIKIGLLIIVFPFYMQWSILQQRLLICQSTQKAEKWVHECIKMHVSDRPLAREQH